MKTPREILLSRHEATTAKLDVIRQRVVVGQVEAPVIEPAAPSSGLFQRVWEEVVWPSRRTWVGLAAAWLVILGLNLAARDRAEPAASIATRSSSVRELRSQLGQQVRLRAELLGIEPRQPAVPGVRSVPGPRSENVNASDSTSA